MKTGPFGGNNALKRVAKPCLTLINSVTLIVSGTGHSQELLTYFYLNFMTKHKYNVGDTVVLIVWGEIYKRSIIKHGEVVRMEPELPLTPYLIGNSGFHPESDLYTKKEAIEFITNYINKEE